MTYEDYDDYQPAHRARVAKPIFYQIVDAKISGRQQTVAVSKDHTIALTGCDGPLTPVQAAAARTLLDDALAFVASREGGGPVDALKTNKATEAA
jgi:hypothetical protein